MWDKIFGLLTPFEKLFLKEFCHVFARLPPQAKDDIAASALKGTTVPELFGKLLKAAGDLGLTLPEEYRARYGEMKKKDQGRRQAISAGHKKRKKAEEDASNANPPLGSVTKSPFEILADLATRECNTQPGASVPRPPLTTDPGSASPMRPVFPSSGKSAGPDGKPPEMPTFTPKPTS